MNLFTVQLSKWRQLKERNIELIDTTVRTGERFLAPSWDIVMGVKNGTLSEAAYTDTYLNMMRQSYLQHREEWQRLIRTTHPIAIACYCGYMVNGERKFCHRHLLRDILEKVCIANQVEFYYFGEFQ